MLAAPCFGSAQHRVHPHSKAYGDMDLPHSPAPAITGTQMGCSGQHAGHTAQYRTYSNGWDPDGMRQPKVWLCSGVSWPGIRFTTALHCCKWWIQLLRFVQCTQSGWHLIFPRTGTHSAPIPSPFPALPQELRNNIRSIWRKKGSAKYFAKRSGFHPSPTQCLRANPTLSHINAMLNRISQCCEVTYTETELYEDAVNLLSHYEFLTRLPRLIRNQECQSSRFAAPAMISHRVHCATSFSPKHWKDSNMSI